VIKDLSQGTEDLGRENNRKREGSRDVSQPEIKTFDKGLCRIIEKATGGVQ